MTSKTFPASDMATVAGNSISAAMYQRAKAQEAGDDEGDEVFKEIMDESLSVWSKCQGVETVTLTDSSATVAMLCRVVEHLLEKGSQ